MMNNKKSKILIGCLTLLLVMSVGYALFSKTITVNGTATAKGEFDITAACTPGVDSKLGTAASLGLDKEGGYKNDSCEVTDNKVKFNVEFDYPGARRHFTIKMTNNGTMDAEIKPDTGISFSYCDYKNDTEKDCSEPDNAITADFEYLMVGNNYVVFEKSDGSLVDESSSEISEFMPEDGSIKLKPGESLYLVMVSGVSEAYEGTGKYTDPNGGKNILFKKQDLIYIFNWSQVSN